MEIFILSMSKDKILKIRLVRYTKTPPAISSWNIFDTEHSSFIHGKRTFFDGMEQSRLLIEKENFFLTIDIQKLPFIPFIKRKSLMFHYKDKENSVYQWSIFNGITIVQKYSAVKDGVDDYRHTVDWAFQLDGYRKLLSPIIKVYAKYWMKKTWDEDLVLKERYYKFLKYGFKNMVGLPNKISDRYSNYIDEDIKTPLPKINVIPSHDFFLQNIKKLFDE